MENKLEALIQAYAYRLFSDPALARKLFGDTEAEFDSLTRLDKLLGIKIARNARKKANSIKTALEAAADKFPMPNDNETVIGRNMARVAESLGLDAIEREIVTVISLTKYNRHFCELLDELEELTNLELANLLALITGHEASAIYERILPNSKLLESNLLMVYMRPLSFGLKSYLISRFYWRVIERDQSIEELFSCHFQKSARSTVTLEDFSGYENDVAILLPYLKEAIKQKKAGCNVLLYGRPGTGKTELSRCITEALHLELWEVTGNEEMEENNDGIAVRNSCYTLAQRLLRNNGKAVILFDECEDNIPKPIWMETERDYNKQSKIYINNMLETNPVPTIWITNYIEHFDPAYIRRFDMILNIDQISVVARKRMITNAVNHLSVDEGWVNRLSKLKDITPAHIQRASHIAMLCHTQDQQAQSLMETQLRQTFQASRTSNELTNDCPYVTDTEFNINYCNTDTNINGLITALTQSGTGRFCFYGPPGTGKTAFAHHLADQINKPLLIKKGSDLMSAFVGETEQNIASAFSEARRNHSVLLIDEADSFLRNRNDSSHSWEVTQVNEFLSQIETFRGIFIITTNRSDFLDSAALRRFDFKIKFSVLAPEQLWEMFCDFLKSSQSELQAHFELVSTLANITPGVFSIAARRQKVLGSKISPDELIQILKQEAEFNRGFGASRRMGFV